MVPRLAWMIGRYLLATFKFTAILALDHSRAARTTLGVSLFSGTYPGSFACPAVFTLVDKIALYTYQYKSPRNEHS